MRSIVLVAVFALLAVSTSAIADSFGKSYEQVKSAACGGAAGNIVMDVEAQELEGRLSDQGKDFEFTFDLLKEEQEADYAVGVIFDFLGSGYDLLGSQVTTVGTDEDSFSFGTYAIVLDKEFAQSQEMTVVYVEAMTGWQSTVQMNCSFSTL